MKFKLARQLEAASNAGFERWDRMSARQQVAGAATGAIAAVPSAIGGAIEGVVRVATSPIALARDYFSTGLMDLSVGGFVALYTTAVTVPVMLGAGAIGWIDSFFTGKPFAHEAVTAAGGGLALSIGAVSLIMAGIGACMRGKQAFGLGVRMAQG